MATLRTEQLRRGDIVRYKDKSWSVVSVIEVWNKSGFDRDETLMRGFDVNLANDNERLHLANVSPNLEFEIGEYITKADEV